MFEKYYLSHLRPYCDKVMSDYLSSYRPNFCTQHVFLRLIEKWRNFLDCNKVVGAVMTDLSKALFDCLPHDLLIAKLAAYSFDHNTIELIHSYLKNRKQSVCINGYHSQLKLLLLGVPHGSILGPILFNIFLNDLFYFILTENLHNFADDNTISDSAETITELTARLENLTGHAIDRLNENQMIANPSKFRAIILKKDQTDASGTSFSGKDHILFTETEVNILGITIEYRLSFDTHRQSMQKGYKSN